MPAMVRPYASSLFGSQYTWISRCGAPAIETVPTPDTRASGVASLSSRIFSNAGRLSCAVAAMIMIGMSSALNLKIIGSDAPSGRTEFTISSLSRTSFVATSMSTPSTNSRMIIEMFSFELDDRFLRSLTAFREFSSTLVRLVSMSSALAPGYDDMTIITFASNLGNLSNDMLISEKTPNMAMAMNMSAVVTGLLTAFLYILITFFEIYSSFIR